MCTAPSWRARSGPKSASPVLPHLHLLSTCSRPIFTCSDVEQKSFNPRKLRHILALSGRRRSPSPPIPGGLGARIGITAVLHTWGSTLTHHPHVHMIVPATARWVASRSNFLVHVNLLARLFSGKMLAMLTDAHDAGQLKFFNAHARLADKKTFKRFIAPLRRIKWVVYCKAPFAGPKQVLRYLSRYTHRVAISNRRLVAADDAGVAFRWKDYRIDGPGRWKTMRLHPHEFIRRFLLHVLPRGFHRIRHYGLFANANRAENIAKARALLGADPPAADPNSSRMSHRTRRARCAAHARAAAPA